MALLVSGVQGTSSFLVLNLKNGSDGMSPVCLIRTFIITGLFFSEVAVLRCWSGDMDGDFGESVFSSPDRVLQLLI